MKMKAANLRGANFTTVSKFRNTIFFGGKKQPDRVRDNDSSSQEVVVGVWGSH